MRFSHNLILVGFGLGLGLSAPALAAESANTRVNLAQLFNRPVQPPADIDDDAPPARGGQDAGALIVRIDRLEGQIRSLTGQIEQLQFQVRRLEEQSRAPTASAAPAQPTNAPPLGAPVVVGSPAASQVATTAESSSRRRNDAFDPAKDPNAPGAPRQLGSTPSTAPLPSTPAGPLASRAAPNAPAGLQPMDLGQPRPAADPQAAPAGTVIATAQPPGPKEEYELAAAFLKQGQYEQAEKNFSVFLAKNPKGRYTADAVFGLGETYFQRNRHREAAEQYLKISTSYSTSSKGAEALLRLGESLNALGAKEQACASFTEIHIKYPNAAKTIQAAEREAKKISC